MNRNVIIPALLSFLLALTAIPTRADGLLYQLPDDGAWVEFDTKVVMHRGDQQRDATGSLRMASVGVATVDGKSCRWIEVKLRMTVDGNDRVIVAKLLVPEDQLGVGLKPVEHRVRGWIRMAADQEVRELTADNIGPLPAFLANPLTDVKPLDAQVVETPWGKLSCLGLTGRTEFVERTSTNKARFETRRHESAPFGVVSSQLEIDVERDGAVAESLNLTLKLSGTGKNAQTELPDHH